MNNPDNLPKLFVVIGVRGTGSGTLTWMEDFDLSKIYEDEDEAKEVCEELNCKNGVPNSWDEEDERDEDTEWELQYDYYPLDFVRKKK